MFPGYLSPFFIFYNSLKCNEVIRKKGRTCTSFDNFHLLPVCLTSAVGLYINTLQCILPNCSSLQVTFGSFDPMWTDSGQCPSLFQVGQMVISLALDMVSLMLHFSWTRVGLLITEGHKALQFLSNIREVMDRNKVCVTYVKMVSITIASYLSAMRMYDILTRETSSINVVIIYHDTNTLNDVNYNIGHTWLPGKFWITNSQWLADMAGRNFILDQFHGILVF